MVQDFFHQPYDWLTDSLWWLSRPMFCHGSLKRTRQDVATAALWDAEHDVPTYSLAIRSSNWLGKVWQTTMQISRTRWHYWDGWKCGHELFEYCFVCCVPDVFLQNLRFGVVDQGFSQCVLTIWNGKRWNMKATALSRDDFKVMKREQVITKNRNLAFLLQLATRKKICRSVRFKHPLKGFN